MRNGAFWHSFLRSLVKRGLTGVELVVSDAHAGLNEAIAQVLGCPGQRCSVHFLREALGHMPAASSSRRSPPCSARSSPPIRALPPAHSSEMRSSGCAPRCPRSRPCWKRPEEDLLAFYGFPAAHWTKLPSTNPLERGVERTEANSASLYSIHDDVSELWKPHPGVIGVDPRLVAELDRFEAKIGPRALDGTTSVVRVVSGTTALTRAPPAFPRMRLP